jgi:MGT family glycosyltransferase
MRDAKPRPAPRGGVLRRFVEMLRASVRLPPDSECRMQFRYLHFVCEPPQFQHPDEQPPPTISRLRRAVFDQSGDEGLPAWIGELPTQPTVYATLGTDPNRPPAAYAAILAAFRDESLNLILTVGRDNNPADFGEQPANIHIAHYIPQSLLMGHCDLVISHGGAGTVLATLNAGLPIINIPIGADQPYNAERCVAMGAGITVPPEERAAEAIRAAVRAVLGDPAYRASAQRVRDEMAAMPGPEHAVRLLERLAVEKQPLLPSSREEATPIVHG